MKRVKLKGIAEINPRKSEIDKEAVDKVSFVAMADVSEDGFISEHETRPLSEVYNGYTYFRKGDVLLAKITPCFENGKAAIADNIPNDIGFGSSEFHVLRTNGKVLPKYLFYALWNEPFREHGSKKMTGSAGQKRVPTNFLKNYEIPLPSLFEQKAIVAKLDWAQRLIDIDKEMLAKFDELIQSVFLEMFGDPVTNPKGWEVKKLGDLTTKVGSGSTPRGGSKVYQDHGNIFIRSQNVLMNKLDFENVAYISDEIHEGMKNTWVQENDVLLNITGASIGRVCVYNMPEAANVNQHVCILRPVQEEIKPYYLSHLISSKNYQDKILGQQTGGTRQAFNMTQIKNFDIPLPPLDLQTQFNEMLTKLKGEIQSLKVNSKKSEELFSSLVQGAFG